MRTHLCVCIVLATAPRIYAIHWLRVLQPETLSAHIGQRIRWARGMIQILRIDNPLLGKGLQLSQRLCYLSSMMHFCQAYRD